MISILKNLIENILNYKNKIINEILKNIKFDIFEFSFCAKFNIVNLIFKNEHLLRFDFLNLNIDFR